MGIAKHELKRVPIADLKAAPYNPRKITPQALKGLTASIKRFGLVQPIVLNKRTGFVVGGHQRIEALRATGEREVDVVMVDLTLAEEKALNVALNSPAISGQFTDDLQPLLDELREDLPHDFIDMRLDDLLVDKLSMAAEEDDVPVTLKRTTCQRGDLWELDGHRLLCGDATDVGDVKRLLGTKKPRLMVTDPPYGVEYDPTWRDGKGGFSDHKTKMRGKITGDTNTNWTKAYQLFPGGIAYVWHGGLAAGKFATNLEDSGFVLRGQIIWVKQQPLMSRGSYHWQHEPCWFAVKKGHNAHWCGDRAQSTVWEVQNLNPTGNREETRTGHGTQKPVEIMRRPIINHLRRGETVYDPFLGSGTTLIAAELTARICYGLEIEPRYCDMILERWQKFTGKTARKI